MERLTGQVAVVTGAAQGIGRAIAERLVAEGANVLCADNNPLVHEVAEALGDAAISTQTDVSKEGDIALMIDTVINRWGRLDCLCNNAGTDGQPAMLAECTASDFDHIIGVNLKGVFLGMNYAIPHMVKAGKGSIINVSSVSGLVGFSTLAIYSASKAGVIGMTKAAALEYGPANIRINAICPGGVLTPLSEEFTKDETIKAQWEDMHPLKRMANAKEIAPLVAFLASEESSFMTGAAIPIDGGYTAA